ncbi:MAG: imidazolonepropionase [Candidatus Palauibacterales bacterium]|nr:imidazolonepropionase [Candidatus Palauibacterales bacterium]
MPALRNIGLLATCAAEGGQGEIHAVPEAALAWDDDGRVTWAGPQAKMPRRLAAWKSEDDLDAGGRLVVPGLVDCHTHLAFGGWRADEFVRRARGESYADIARAGGGILATVRATRETSEDELVERAAGFLERMLALGVTTVEAKSGYGLDLHQEIKLLRVYRRLAERVPQALVPTLLAAHAVPPEYAGDREGYVWLVCEEIVPAAAEEGLARFCDVFVEEGAFTPADARRVLEAGRKHGMAPRLHVDQLRDGGGAELAAELGAVSADHLEHVSPAGIRALAAASTVGVALPLASLYLGAPPAPARRMVRDGVAVAVATDFNPGSAPSYHLPLAMTLACVQGGLTPAEALKGATLIAARACGEEERAGSLEKGKAADFAILDAPDVETWLYHHRPNACVATVIGGRVTWRADA